MITSDRWKCGNFLLVVTYETPSLGFIDMDIYNNSCNNKHHHHRHRNYYYYYYNHHRTLPLPVFIFEFISNLIFSAVVVAIFNLSSYKYLFIYLCLNLSIHQISASLFIKRFENGSAART